jgi:hydrogenase-4 membrane subunit HyfE
LPELSRLASELDDPALIVAVTVRRLHTRRRMWRVRQRIGFVGEGVGLAFYLMLFVALYFGFPLLVALALISDRVVAVVVALVAAPLLMVGAAKGWVRFDD